MSVNDDKLEQAGKQDEAPADVQPAPVAPPPPPTVTFPEGGFRAWAVVVSCCLLALTSFGQASAFGVFTTYYLDGFLPGYSAASVAWIGTLQLVLPYVLAPVLGRGLASIGIRGYLCIGGVLNVFCYVMTSLSTKYYQILLAQGLGLGLSFAIQFIPILAIPSHYFLRRRALILGIIMAGSSISGVIYPILVAKLLAEIGYGWTLRVLALVTLVLQAVAIPFVKERLPRTSAASHASTARAILKDRTFLLHIAGGFCAAFSLYSPFTYIELYSLELGLSSNFAFYTISIMSATGAIGRVVTGFVSDRFGRFNVLIPMCAASAAVVFALWIPSRGLAPVVIFCLLAGFFISAWSSVAVSCSAQLAAHPSEIGARIAYFSLAMVPGILTGPVISGAILGPENENFLGLQIFVGVMLVVGTIFSIGARMRGTGGKVWAKF